MVCCISSYANFGNISVFIDSIAKIFGVDYPPSLFFVFCIIFLVLINFRSSRRIAIQNEKITELAQHIAILEEKVNDK